jgi:hypothetical protein
MHIQEETGPLRAESLRLRDVCRRKALTIDRVGGLRRKREIKKMEKKRV